MKLEDIKYTEGVEPAESGSNPEIAAELTEPLKYAWTAEPDGDPEDRLWMVKEGDLLVCDCMCEESAKMIARLYNRQTVVDELAAAAYDMSRKPKDQNDEEQQHLRLHDACAAYYDTEENVE